MSNELVQCISGVRGYEKDGVAYLHIEDVARGLGFTEQKDGVDYVRWRTVDSHLSNLSFATSCENGNQHDYHIPENIFYRLCMKAKNAVAEAFQAKVADEIIPSIRRHGMYATDDFIQRSISDPDWAISMLQRLKFEREQKELALKQRDEAIATKSWIGSKREATAMNTASQKSKECEKLREQIGDAKGWKAVQSIRWLKDFFALSQGLYLAVADKLKKICLEFGLERHEIPDKRYGVLKTYPVKAIDILKERVESDPNMLFKYRKA